jgi:hypothetical protein
MILIRRLIGGRQQYFRDGNAEHLRAPIRCLEVDDRFELGPLADRKATFMSRFCTSRFWEAEAWPWGC